MTSNNLTVPEQMAIGGADSIRGYPQSELLGDYGYQGTCELRIPPPLIGNWKDPITHRQIKDFTQLLGFVDIGEVYIKKPQMGENNKTTICGAGFGIRIDYLNNFSFRMDVGFPVGGREPSDGSKASTYVQAIARF